MDKSKLIIMTILLFSFVISIYFYPLIPERMASRWDFQGKAIGHIPKILGMFLVPFILVGLAIFFLVIPMIDPLKANIKKFRKYYSGFVILLLIFMLLTHLWMIFWNLGIETKPNIFFSICFGILFFYLGILSENARRNWFIGIRTPWTLSDERVWNKTHKISGGLFKAVGIIAFFGVFFQNYAWFFVLVPIILVLCFTFVYSCLEYKKLHQD